jgi:hypothetical protein
VTPPPPLDDDRRREALDALEQATQRRRPTTDGVPDIEAQRLTLGNLRKLLVWGAGLLVGGYYVMTWLEARVSSKIIEAMRAHESQQVEAAHTGLVKGYISRADHVLLRAEMWERLKATEASLKAIEQKCERRCR